MRRTLHGQQGPGKRRIARQLRRSQKTVAINRLRGRGLAASQPLLSPAGNTDRYPSRGKPGSQPERPQEASQQLAGSVRTARLIEAQRYQWTLDYIQDI